MIVNCSACDKDLIELISVEENFTKKVIVKCPYCFDQSYEKEVGNRYSIRPEDGLDLLDVDDKNYENCKVLVYLAEI